MRHTCRTCALRSRSICRALPDATLESVNRISRRRRVAAGCALFKEEEGAGLVANVLKGVAKVSVSLPDGRTQVVGLHFPGDFIGRPFAASSPPLMEAATEVELCCFERSRFETLLADHKRLEELLLRRMTAELDAARDWMLLLGHKTAEERVASLILLCLRRLQPQDCRSSSAVMEDVFELPLSRTEMAQFLGLTIETVSRMLKRLAGNGIITIGRGRAVAVRDAEELERCAESHRP